MTNLKNKSRKLKRSLKIKRRLRGGDCKGVVRNNDPTFWPINRGCVANSGTIVTLQVGTIIDRFGDATGKTFSPVNAGVPYTYEARAMPFMKMGDFRTQSNCNNEYNDYAQQNYNQYEVTRQFDVYRCVVNDFQYNNDPEQSYEGGAIQYTLTANSIPNAEKSTIRGFRDTDAPNVDDMLHLEYLKIVVPDRIPQFRNPIAVPYQNPGAIAVPYQNPGPIAVPYPDANPNPNPNADPNENLFNNYNNPYIMASMWGGGKRRRSVKRKRNNKRFT